ncbi:MAG: HDOD domain-containing protein [Synechococcaceae cyanobacterium SM1_2_3]|nr:HDOD domain-containing protein [Synechococcaceae cyanobacterium SM1_2_3]
MCQHSLQDQIIHALSSDALQLPAFPAVAMKLQQALSSPNAKIADLETLIINDQALSSQILRVANSSFYQGLQRVVSIRKAIIRLGARQVASLALSIAQRSLYVTRSALLGRYMERLWRHAFVSATGCQWLASHCGHKQSADAAYMAGLLHDIGTGDPAGHGRSVRRAEFRRPGSAGNPVDRSAGKHHAQCAGLRIDAALEFAGRLFHCRSRSSP